MNRYRSVKNSISAEYEEKRSRFLCTLYPVTSQEEAENFIALQSAKYYDAKHHVFAFRLKNGVERCSDDGEPQGTSGQPTLQVLKNAEITDVLAVTTRYFGGILLGGGGLFRAYTTAVKTALENAEIVEYRVYRKGTIQYPYSFHSQLLRAFERFHCIVKETEYGETVKCQFAVLEENSQDLQTHITETSNGTLLCEYQDCCYIGG